MALRTLQPHGRLLKISRSTEPRPDGISQMKRRIYSSCAVHESDVALLITINAQFDVCRLSAFSASRTNSNSRSRLLSKVWVSPLTSLLSSFS